MDDKRNLETGALVFTTQRLSVRRGGPQDAGLFLCLWTSPTVMRYVGFPQGLPTSRKEISARLAAQAESPLDALLVVERRSDGKALGECKLGRPDAAGLATTDIKLLPDYWGHGFGREIKAGLLNYLFTQTACRIVAATPNVANVASIRMQEAVGGVRVGEATVTFPPHMAAYTAPVHHFVYHVRRESWERAQQSPPDSGH